MAILQLCMHVMYTVLLLHKLCYVMCVYNMELYLIDGMGI